MNGMIRGVGNLCILGFMIFDRFVFGVFNIYDIGLEYYYIVVFWNVFFLW